MKWLVTVLALFVAVQSQAAYPRGVIDLLEERGVDSALGTAAKSNAPSFISSTQTATMFSGHTSLNLPASTTAFFALSNTHSNTVTSDVSGGTRTLFPRAATLTNFFIIAAGTVGNNQTNTVHVMTNGVATNLRVTITGTSQTAGNDTTNSVNVLAGWEVGIRMVTTSSTTARKFAWGLEAR